MMTYPNLGLDLEEIIHILKVKLLGKIWKEYLIVREYHESGLSHIHVYIKLEKKVNITDKHRLDIEGHHGKYEGVKDRAKLIEYFLKDVTDPHDPRTILGSSNIMVQVSETGVFEKWIEAVMRHAKEGRVDRAMQIWEFNAPRQYALSHKRIEKSLWEIAGKARGLQLRVDYSDFILPIEIQEALEELKFAIKSNNPAKTPILIGDPGIGKTKMIRWYLRSEVGLADEEILVVNNIDSLRFMNPSRHRVIVFDDVDWREVRGREELITLLDSLGDIKTLQIKHSSVQLGITKKVVLSNKPLREYVPLLIDGAVQRRINEFHIKDPLFYDSPPVDVQPSST